MQSGNRKPPIIVFRNYGRVDKFSIKISNKTQNLHRLNGKANYNFYCKTP